MVNHDVTTTVKSIALTDGTRYFFLSIVGISVLSAFSQITYPSKGKNIDIAGPLQGQTGIRSGYF